MSQGIDRDRWAQLSIVEQMANIGSEVGRTFAARSASQSERFAAALERALDLFAATTELLVAQKSNRVREVLRARDQFLNAIFGDGDNPANIAAIDDYFLHFGIAARAAKSIS